jgi:hypothetical protein
VGFKAVNIVILFAISFCTAGRVCNLSFTECPGKFTATTIAVPNEVIWLDPKIPYCNEPVQISPAGPPPSIIFIIDNSGSMDENDPEVARFSVVKTLLDEIYSVAPNTEVGLVIFTRRLAFDHRENSFFHTAFPGDTTQHDSFVPLTALNKIFPGNVLGVDTLKALLDFDARGNLTYITRRPASRNNSGMGRTNTRDGTDISLGFQAAKVAMKDSKSDKSKQFFIFLSDGTPSTPDNGREGLINEFINGASTPSTFTVFFDTQHSPPIAPSTIVQMTNNIKANVFSPNNLKTAYWAINTPGAELENILQVQVLGNVIFLPTTPKQGTLVMGEQTFNSTGVDSKGFIFPKRVPLSKVTTQVLLNYTYGYVDTTGGKQIPKEKLVPYLVTVQRTAGVALPRGLGQSCQEQGDINLYHAGQPVSVVKADDEILEARLSFPNGQVCLNCKLQVSPSSSRSKDAESLSLAATGGIMSGTFQREISLTPSFGDGKLQHLPLDSIVLTWQNPENSLDIIRKSFLYIDVATTLAVNHAGDFAKTPVVRLPAISEWIMVGPPDLKVTAAANQRWRLYPGNLTLADSLSHVGVVLEASRAFMVDIHVYSNIGQFINKISFTVPTAEFEKLPRTGKGSTRSMRVLWDNRTEKGSPVGTGAYVVKTTLTLLKLPGIAEDNAVRNDYRVVGVLRSL